MQLGLGSWDLTLFCGRWHNSRCLFFREGSLCTSDVDITQMRGALPPSGSGRLPGGPPPTGKQPGEQLRSTAPWGQGSGDTGGSSGTLLCDRRAASSHVLPYAQPAAGPWVHARVALHTVRQGLRLPTGLDTRCCSVKFQVPRPLTSAQEERGPSERGSLLGLTGKIRF